VTLILLPVVHERSEYRRRRCVADDGVGAPEVGFGECRSVVYLRAVEIMAMLQ
jgi:hypothetical protein